MAKTKRKSYQCHNEPCYACGTWNVQRCYHHLITRKNLGPDEKWNLLPLDAKHHQEVHQIGLRRFARKYPGVMAWLTGHGWQFDEYSQKWLSPNQD